ncbi:MAG: tetratricopeptide repeat protein [Fulvivirga sp.]|nr:tetratricopeptide repeat protein [Fulvivirga sp.]
MNLSLPVILMSLAGILGFSLNGTAKQEASWSKEEIDERLRWAENISIDGPDTALSVARASLSQAENINYFKGILNARYVKAKSFRVLGKFDSADQIFNQLLETSTELNDSILMGKVLYQRAQLTYDKGDPTKSLKILDDAFEVRSGIPDSAGISQVYNIRGNIYVDLGLYYQALEAYQKAMNIDLLIDNMEGVASRYNNIARIYTFQNENEKAAEYYQKAYDIALQQGNKTDQAIYANNIAHLLKIEGKYEEALAKLNRAIQIHDELNTTCRKIYPMYNKGSIYVRQGLLDSAAFYLNWVLPKTMSCESDQYLRCLTLIDLGKMNIRKGNYNEAIELLENAFDAADKFSLPAQKMSAAHTLYAVYDSTRQLNEAIHYLQVYHSLNDSLYSVESTRKQARLEAQYVYEQEKKEEELKNRLEEAKREKELANAIWVRNTFIAGFLVLLIIVFLIYRNYTRKVRANNKLNQLNQLITRQKEALETQARELRNANEEITRINENLEQIANKRTRVITKQNKKILEYAYYNAHQVRGPLARILGLVSLFENQNITQAEFEQKLHELRQEAHQLDQMVKKMNRSLEKGKQSLQDHSPE